MASTSSKKEINKNNKQGASRPDVTITSLATAPYYNMDKSSVSYEILISAGLCNL